jgi:hypothetical protein
MKPLCLLTAYMIFCIASTATAQIELFTDDVTVPIGVVPFRVYVDSEQQVSSLNVSLGTTLLSGNASSKLTWTAYDSLVAEDSIWADSTGLWTALTPPGLPGPDVKVNHAFLIPGASVLAKGAVVELTLDTSEASPGDVFQVDLNFDFGSSAALGATVLSEQLMFRGGTVTIESEMSLLGDFNDDGLLDVHDIDLLTQAVKDASPELRFDLNQDGMIDQADRAYWVKDIKNTYFGDADLNGVFDTSDFVKVLQAGHYEDEIVGNSTWATGDWSGDCEFNTNDLILVFQEGGYEMGPRAATGVAAVPEPSAFVGGFTAMLIVAIRNRSRRSP